MKGVDPDVPSDDDPLVLDVGLPGMSGIELYDRVRQDDNLKRVQVMFEILISLFERAYLLAFDDNMTGKQLRRWRS